MPFLIPLAGLALGALGRLASLKRSRDALSAAGASVQGSSNEVASALSSASTAVAPLEGPAPPAAAGRPSPARPGVAQIGSGAGTSSDADRGVGEGSKTGPTGGTQPATGPVQQNQGSDSPTPAPGDDAGLAARLGRQSVRDAKTKNRSQTREHRLGSQAMK